MRIFDTASTTIYILVSILNMLFAIGVVFVERRNIGATWAWLVIFLFLPGVGFIIYLFFGQNLSKRKRYRIKGEQLKQIVDMIEDQKYNIQHDMIEYKDTEISRYQDMIYMNLVSDYAYFTQDNEIEVFTEGAHKFESLLKEIDQAEHHIHLMYYIVRNDKLGNLVLSALTKKALEGVQVRFLFDDIGNARLPRRLFKSLIEAGGQAVAFFPSRIPYMNFRLNFRNHRKLAIIDGVCGYIGGFNIGDEYLGVDHRYGYWRDTHFKIKGSSVIQMQALFLLDWNLASSNEISYDPMYFPISSSEGTAAIQIVSSGPNDNREQIKNALIKTINSAKRTVYLQTPYFVPDESLLNAMKMAALSGVDVRIMIPGNPDKRFMSWASYSYLGDLLNVGVKCYLYKRGFLHAKTIVADGMVCSVGTSNIDIRSFKLNFEVNAIVYNTSTATTLKEIFEVDMKDCIELTLEIYNNRSLFNRFIESLARLLSPVL
ncbi:MAG: cardiolipin synthase [Paenibacillaceae bacterium]